MTDDEKQENKTPDLFERMADTKFERDVLMPEDDEEPSEDGHRSYSDAEAESPTDSDLKTTLKRMFPKFADPYINEVAQAVMIARITPDTILDRIYLTVIAIIEKQEVDSVDVDVMMTINLVTTAFEIGLDAKGRIDAIELAGSAKEAEELAGLSRTMGFQ